MLNKAFGDVSAEVYRYDSANLNQIVRDTDLFIDGGQTFVTLPGYSITLLELPASSNWSFGLWYRRDGPERVTFSV